MRRERHFVVIAGSQAYARASEQTCPWHDAIARTTYLLDDGALFASTDGEHFQRVTRAHAALRFEPSTLVSAPLVVHEGALWAASPRAGEVFVATGPE